MIAGFNDLDIFIKSYNKVIVSYEVSGRRIARLNNLKLTGSLGIIISAIKKGENINIKDIISNMRENGVWISKELEKKLLSWLINSKVIHFILR